MKSAELSTRLNTSGCKNASIKVCGKVALLWVYGLTHSFQGILNKTDSVLCIMVILFVRKEVYSEGDH